MKKVRKGIVDLLKLLSLITYAALIIYDNRATVSWNSVTSADLLFNLVATILILHPRGLYRLKQDLQYDLDNFINQEFLASAMLQFGILFKFCGISSLSEMSALSIISFTLFNILSVMSIVKFKRHVAKNYK